jgi:hypothetical protein
MTATTAPMTGSGERRLALPSGVVGVRFIT